MTKIGDALTAVGKAEPQVVAFWSKHKKTLTLILVAVLLFFGGFVSGRYTKHPQVVEKEKLVYKEREQTQTQDRTVKKQDVQVAKKKHQHTKTTTTKKPDGTVTTTTETDIDTNTGVDKKTNIDTTHQETVTKYVDRIVEKEKQVLKQPDWRAYAGVGVSLPYYLGQGYVGVPGLNGWVVQAGVDRRIVGPFWFGVFGNTQGTVGLNLSAVW